LKNTNGATADRIVLFSGAVTAAIGFTVIVGWFAKSTILIKILPSAETMRFNEALGFFIGGAGLIGASYGFPRVLKACGLFILTLGVLSLLEYVAGIDIGIDGLIVKDTISAVYPGRANFMVALGFAFTGAAFLLTDTAGRLLRFPAVFLVPTVVAIGITSLFGYYSRGMVVNTWWDFNFMAVHAAVGLLVLGAGTLAFAWRNYQVEEKSALQWLLVVMGVAVLTATLMLWRASAVHESANIDRLTRLRAEELKANIRDLIESRVQALSRMASRWERKRSFRKEWESDADLYMRSDEAYKAILWVDPRLHASWAMPHEFHAGVTGGGAFIEKQARLAFNRARGEFATEAAPSVFRQSDLLMVYVPVFHKNRFEGVVVGAFMVDKLLGSIPEEGLYGYSVVIADDDGEIYRWDTGRLYKKWTKEERISFYGADWKVLVSPQRHFIAGSLTRLPNFILITGLLASSLISAIGYFAQILQVRARSAEAAKQRLEEEMAERNRIEEELKRSAAELRRSNAELEQFASIVSHDLQEPLRIISGYLQLISRRYRGRQLDEKANDLVGIAVNGASRMSETIKDLLDYSRVGSRHKDFKPFDCSAILTRSLANLRRSIEETDAIVRHDDLPTITADAFQMEHLFMNLISNAIKYRGNNAPLIYISCERRGEEWLFSVSDNGIGIDPNYHEKIFEMFQRVYERSRYQGTGIGLAICKRVVENHGGRIWVESKPGEGSNFYFTIPVKPA
jgi:signal transduction histidine kinase